MCQIFCKCLFQIVARKRCRFCVFVGGLTASIIVYVITDMIHISHVKKTERQNRIHQYFLNVSKSAHKSNNDFQSADSHGTDVSNTCVLPELPLWSPEIRTYLKNIPKVECSRDKDWVYTHNGIFYISPEAETKHGDIRCAYIPIVNSHDQFKELKPIVPMLNGSNLTSDAFKVTCKATSGKRYMNIHACIAPTPEQKRPEVKPEQFNIFIFGFDSISRQMFKRVMPKTHAYFTNALGGQLLEGYNIIGDGTPQALMPLLTGKQETEIPEIRRGKPGARSVDDVLTFLWTRCEQKGYVTQWGEDMAHVGTFNLRMLGFSRQPVHHYMRPFYLAAIPMFSYFRKNCFGSKPRYQVYLDWLKEGLITNKARSFFTFGFFSELSHNNNSPVSVMDESNVRFLQFMQNNGFLDKTILIMMSDHGLRFGPLRATEQGKFEERLPYFGFRFPETFKQKFPDKVNAFNINTKRLVTPLDVHETLLDVIGEHDNKNNVDTLRKLSLFEPIPANRTCAAAGIEPHWCACLKQTRVSESDFTTLVSVNAVLTLINEMLEPFLDVCYKLSLKEVTKAFKLETHDQVLKFRGSLDADGRIPDLNDTLEAKEVTYQVTFVTKPNNGLFEATVKLSTDTGNCKVNSADISRLNKYGDDPKCIVDVSPNLRPYCLCRQNNGM